MSLTEELYKWQCKIERWATEYGLDYFPVIFEMLDYDTINAIASYGGFPTRYPHWRFGMQYDYMNKGYTFGLQKIYEMVINNNPCYAYLQEANSLVDQKLVMAHVYGHCDFFKNNYTFTHTNRKMMDKIANNANIIRSFYEKYGYDKVERFLDCVLSLENLIDHHSVHTPQKKEEKKNVDNTSRVVKLKAKSYMDKFINPPEFLEEQQRLIDKKMEKNRQVKPKASEKDVLAFLSDNAPLESWKKTIIDIVREEAYYFAPQGQTKIMNEGWASLWHSKMMTEKILSDSEIVDFADHHAGTMAVHPGSLNPYKLGLEIFRDIIFRWDTGRFGKEWDEIEDFRVKNAWNKKLNLGMKKIFEVRALYNDITFIDTFLTDEFIKTQKLFTYAFNQKSKSYVITSRDCSAIRQQLLQNLTNFGDPYIKVVDGNYENRGELLLHHRHEGADLDVQKAMFTLRNLCEIWGRPVNLSTVFQGNSHIISFDGEKFKGVNTQEKKK